VSFATRLLLANPGAQVSSALSGSLTTPGAKREFLPSIVGAYDALSTVIVPSGGLSSVTFAGIPQTGYSHLQIRAIFRDNRSNSGSGSYADLTFNGVTSGYAYHQLYGGGSGTPGAAANSNYSVIEVTRVADAGSTTGVFGATVIDILDYTNTSRNKTVRAIGGFDNNGTGAMYVYSGLATITSSIYSLTIADGGGTLFSEHSSFSLYGVK
jgi:hypothetical protein